MVSTNILVRKLTEESYEKAKPARRSAIFADYYFSLVFWMEPILDRRTKEDKV